MEKQFSPEELRALAAEIAERILRNLSPAGSAGGGTALPFKCPPKKLCCFVGYGCDSPFNCRPGFDCTHSFAIYPP
jgi:hypothetical protein